jgi:hypothetical protein
MRLHVVTLALFLTLPAFSQCNMPGMHMPPKKEQKPAPEQHDHMNMKQSVAMHGRKASGTAWQPESTPGYMWMTERDGWALMLHGQVFLTYNQQGGARGAGKLESSNWAMFMEGHSIGRGQIEFRQMLSAEPLTFPHPGSPELFQTGETYHGAPLVDHQHPHDTIGELAFLLTEPLGEHVKWEFYGGAVGEPALGPVTFMHRGSASEMPFAPLGHHLEDSTHITHGVVTSGFVVGKFKVEGSAFNGREPDEDRVDIDFAPLDSFSGRAAFAPNHNWAMQYSFGHLRHPEALEVTDVNRQTASLMYNRPLPHWRGNWSTSLIWGRNHKTFDDTRQNGYLLESVLNFRAQDYAYTRMELVDKDELFPFTPVLAPNFRIGAFTFGGVRDLVQNDKGQIGLGADVTFYAKPAALDPFYGDNPVSFRVFLRFRPGKMQH